MKTQIFSLMLSAAIFTTSPLFAMDDKTAESLTTAKTQRPRLNKEEVERVKELAAKNIPSCQYQLGILYEEGVEILQDYKQAAFYFRKAAERRTLQTRANPCSDLTNPDQLVAYVYQQLGYTHASKPMPNYQRALYWYNESLKLDPSTGPVGQYVAAQIRITEFYAEKSKQHQ